MRSQNREIPKAPAHAEEHGHTGAGELGYIGWDEQRQLVFELVKGLEDVGRQLGDAFPTRSGRSRTMDPGGPPGPPSTRCVATGTTVTTIGAKVKVAVRPEKAQPFEASYPAVGFRAAVISSIAACSGSLTSWPCSRWAAATLWVRLTMNWRYSSTSTGVALRSSTSTD